MGLAPTHRKTILATETLKTESTKNSSLEGEGSSSRGPKPPCDKSRKNRETTGLSTLLSTKQINMGGTEGIDKMGSAWTTNHHSIFQNREKEN